MSNPKFSQSLIPVLVILILLCLLISCHPAAPLEKVTIADASSGLAAPVYKALELGYFRDKGLEVSLQKHTFGGGSLQAILDREADFSISSETPFMHAVLPGGALQAVATTIKATNHPGIAAQMSEALVPGQVDAIATWNPNVYLAQKQLGQAGLTFQDDNNIYAIAFLISARQDYVEAHPEMPNYLTSINFSGLEAVNPQAVRIIPQEDCDAH
jgi:ABC-type nitrate/sulfonate/bicarbonate transport system substrate-binding protein